MQHLLISLLLTSLLYGAGLSAEAPGPLSPAAHVVGNGQADSCTQDKLFAALDLGGAITFNCGAAPKVIKFASARVITATASLDGGNLITLSGDNTTRLFQVIGGFSLTLSRISLSNASVSDDGGAIRNEDGAVLVINHATFYHNRTDITHSGGAILNLGTLTINDSVFDSNSAGNGGALFPRYTDSNTTIANSLFVHNSTLNTTDGWGGAMLLWDGAPVTVQNSQFISNTARWGGALYVFHGASVAPPTSLTLTNSLLTANLADGGPSADGGGGAIYNNARLVLAETTVDNNRVPVPDGFGFPGIRAGGAIWNSTDGTIQLSGGGLSGNAALHGGALYNLGNVSLAAATLANNLAGRGGAIESANNAGNSLTISATTLSGNQVSAAIYPAITTPLGAAIFNTAHLDITNSTVSGNSGQTAIQEDNSVITLTNVTLAHNANGGLGSDQSPNTSQVHLFSTLLDHNGPSDCGTILFATFTSENGLASDNSCAAFWTIGPNQNAADPLLSPLGYHGGPTLTHMPAAGSPAVDLGAHCPSIDQRGVSRLQDAACDIGAVERQPGDAFYWLFAPLMRR